MEEGNNVKLERIQKVNGGRCDSVQHFQLREAAKVRWDGASQLIRGEIPDRATMKQ